MIFLTALLGASCACARQHNSENCRSSVDGPWAFVGPAAPAREDIERNIIGMSSAEISSLLGGRKSYRYLANENKGYWYIERRRNFSEDSGSGKCASIKFDQSFLILEVKFGEDSKAIACSTQTKEVLSGSVIGILQIEKAEPGPLDGEKRQCEPVK